MATQSENADIAVLQTEMRTLKDAALRIETKLDAFNAMFVTRGEFNAFKRQYWLSHSMTAIITAAITGLVLYFLKVKGA